MVNLVLEEEIKVEYDLFGDDSITKFVNNEVSFLDKSYIPEDLSSFKSEYIVDTKGNQKLRSIVGESLNDLAKDFNTVFNTRIYVVSSYRSYNYQKGIKDRGCSDNLCAKAGFSEHQSGLAVDLWEASTEKQFLSNPNYKKYFEWMSYNAHLYGFTNTYQKGVTIDGYEIEPWHWRYVGVDLATELKVEEITIAEYYSVNMVN